MKYVLYIDYRSGRSAKPYAYIPLKATTLGEAILEADDHYNATDMYLVRIMVKDGAAENPERGLRCQRYTSRYEKRSYRWYPYDETDHYTMYCKSKYGCWFA